MHTDKVIKSSLDTRQLMVCIECAACYGDDSIAYGWHICSRRSGTKSEDCFNVVSFNAYQQTVKVVRFGVDRDCTLRHKGCMYVNGAAGTVEYSD